MFTGPINCVFSETAWYHHLNSAYGITKFWLFIDSSGEIVHIFHNKFTQPAIVQTNIIIQKNAQITLPTLDLFFTVKSLYIFTTKSPKAKNVSKPKANETRVFSRFLAVSTVRPMLVSLSGSWIKE